MLLFLLACAENVAKDSAFLDSGPSGSTPAGADALALSAQVSEAELSQSIAELEGFGTRYIGTQGHADARAYLIDRFADYGLIAEEDPFEADGVSCANVIARIEGTTRPEEVYIFSAHFDSTSNEAPEVAPGADDNASGVAAVLEAARILSQQQPAASIWFVLTDAEEQGSLGSLHLAEALAAEGVDVRGVIAPDMIAYWPLEDGDAFDILGDEASYTLAWTMADVADALGVAYKVWIDHFYCYGDDHTRFQEVGYPSISPMDCVEAHNEPGSGEDTPHYHKTTDTSETLYMPFTARVAGVIVATLAVLAE